MFKYVYIYIYYNMNKTISLFLNYLIILPIVLNFLFIVIITYPRQNKFHPLSLLIILIITIFLISLKINYLYKTWLSFILFLSIIGGLIVIYIYITRISNNEFFSINFDFIILSFLKALPFVLIVLLLVNNIPNNLFLNFNIQNTWDITIYYNSFDVHCVNSIYNKITNHTTIFIILYLFFSIICIINICYKFKAPLRQLIF